jgi:Uma2 family endonuclease
MEAGVPRTVEATGGLGQEAAMTLEKRRAGRHGPRPVHYPESDGKPMAESDLHRNEMVRLIGTLEDAFEDRPDVYVSGNLLIYYEEGNPRASVAPDVFVVIGVAKRERLIYKLWEEGVPPTVVIEVTSPTTRREDRAKKWSLYARLGVREYVMYDPRDEYLRPPLQAYHLESGDYRAMPMRADGSFYSVVLNMGLRLVDGRLRFFDNGNTYLSPAERADAEAAARIAAERRAEIEARRADDEATARVAAERRIAELEALLRERDQR